MIWFSLPLDNTVPAVPLNHQKTKLPNYVSWKKINYLTVMFQIIL